MQNKEQVHLNTSTVVILSMIAGVGLSNLEVSTWVRVILDMTSLLVERVFELARGVAEIASSDSLAMVGACLLASFLAGLALEKIIKRVRG